jgi:hypothetical protein
MTTPDTQTINETLIANTNSTTVTKKHIQLPLFKDTTTLPTGKNHISFSEILIHSGNGLTGTSGGGCSYKHKLQYIDKVPQDNDGSIHTAFGKVLHDALEKFLMTGKMPPIEECSKMFVTQFEELKLTEEKREKDKQDLPAFLECIPDILSQIPPWLNTTFPGWKTYSAEQPIFEKMDKQNSIYFKGFIDAVIKIPKKQKKITKKEMLLGEAYIPPKIEYEYLIIDAKTCSWGWSVEQKRDFGKHMQLALYKHYFSKITNIPLTNIKTAFVLLKRTVPKTRKEYDRLELVTISTGPVTIQKALDISQHMVNKVRRGFVVKNRMACDPFCGFKGTKFCI